jgi:hypothetical protein
MQQSEDGNSLLPYHDTDVSHVLEDGPEGPEERPCEGFVLTVKYTSLLMIPASVAVIVFSRNLIYLTYGSDYTFASYCCLCSIS